MHMEKAAVLFYDNVHAYQTQLKLKIDKCGDVLEHEEDECRTREM